METTSLSLLMALAPSNAYSVRDVEFQEPNRSELALHFNEEIVEEIVLLDWYHAEVGGTLTPLVDPETARWPTLRLRRSGAPDQIR
jgi:hypothetical protein